MRKFGQLALTSQDAASHRRPRRSGTRAALEEALAPCFVGTDTTIFAAVLRLRTYMSSSASKIFSLPFLLIIGFSWSFLDNTLHRLRVLQWFPNITPSASPASCTCSDLPEAGSRHQVSQIYVKDIYFRHARRLKSLPSRVTSVYPGPNAIKDRVVQNPRPARLITVYMYQVCVCLYVGLFILFIVIPSLY
jgi:hypothetical protein